MKPILGAFQRQKTNCLKMLTILKVVCVRNTSQEGCGHTTDVYIHIRNRNCLIVVELRHLLSITDCHGAADIEVILSNICALMMLQLWRTGPQRCEETCWYDIFVFVIIIYRMHIHIIIISISFYGPLVQVCMKW